MTDHIPLSAAETALRNLPSTKTRDDETVSLEAALDALRGVAEALKPWVDLACESHGVTGFHLNGDVAEWDELGMPSTPADAQAARDARDAEVRRKALEEALDCVGHITQAEDRDAILALIEKGQTNE